MHGECNKDAYSKTELCIDFLCINLSKMKAFHKSKNIGFF